MVVLYLDGQRSARHVYINFNFGDMKNSKNSITIALPDKIIEVDLIARTAIAIGNMNIYLAQEYEKLPAAEKAIVEENAEKLGISIAQALGGARPPRFPRAPSKASRGDRHRGRHYLPHLEGGGGVTLKTQGALMGVKIHEEAVSIETGLVLKPGVFEVSAGIAVTFDKESDQMQHQMIGATLAMLKDSQFDAKRKQGGPAAMIMAPGMNPAEGDEAEEDNLAPRWPKSANSRMN